MAKIVAAGIHPVVRSLATAQALLTGLDDRPMLPGVDAVARTGL